MIKQGRGGRIIGASSLAGKTGVEYNCMLARLIIFLTWCLSKVGLCCLPMVAANLPSGD
jgi:hypothetical protein